MISAATLLGAPQSFLDKCLIYPPKVIDVATKPYYWQYVKILTLSQEEIEDDLVEKIEKGDKFPTPIEFLLNNSYHNERYNQLTLEAFKFFLRMDVTLLFDQKTILLGKLEDAIKNSESVDSFTLITEEEFFLFQNAIRAAIGSEQVEAPNPKEDPRVKRIKAKARYRDKIKAKQGAGIRLDTSLASICCMGLGLNPLNIGEMSYASIGTLMRTYQEKEKYETDIRSLQAGADSKKVKPKYWIRNLD